MTAYATFTPQALHREEFATRQYTATADGKGGDLIQCADGLVGVVAGMKPYLNGDIITLRLVDAYDVPCASGTGFADGVDVYWNSSTKLAVATPPTPGFFIGPARGAKASGATAVRVLLNGGGMTLTSTTLSFTGSTGGNTIQVPNTLADALDIKDVAGNGYLQVNSTAGNVSLTGVSTGVTNARIAPTRTLTTITMTSACPPHCISTRMKSLQGKRALPRSNGGTDSGSSPRNSTARSGRDSTSPSRRRAAVFTTRSRLPGSSGRPPASAPMHAATRSPDD